MGFITNYITVRGKPAADANPVPVNLMPAPSSVTPTSATLVGATKTVVATGTPEALGTGTAREVFIFPLRTNTGQVYWGTSSTNDTQHGTLPIVLTAPTGKVIDIAGIYLDVTVAGEGVRYTTVN